MKLRQYLFTSSFIATIAVVFILLVAAGYAVVLQKQVDLKKQNQNYQTYIQTSVNKSVDLPNTTLLTYWVDISESGRCLGVQESYSNEHGENFVHYPLIRCESTGGYDLIIVDQNKTYALIRGLGQIREGPSTGYIYHIIDLASHKLIHTGYDDAKFLGDISYIDDDILFLGTVASSSAQLFSIKDDKVIAEWVPNNPDKLAVGVDWLNRDTFKVSYLKAKDVLPDVSGDPGVPAYEILNTEFYNIEIYSSKPGTPPTVGFVKVNK
ncbi:MAG: hypothetical protein WC575_01740 [Patescibacteria group bacterium]